MQSPPTYTNPYASPAQPVPSARDSLTGAARQSITPQEFSQLGLCKVGLLLIIIALVTSLLSVSCLAVLSAAEIPVSSARGALAIIGLLYLASAGLTLIGHGFLMAAPPASDSKGLFQTAFALTIIVSVSPFFLGGLNTSLDISLPSFVLTVIGISATFMHLTGLARLSDFVHPSGPSFKFTSSRLLAAVGMILMVAILPIVLFFGRSPITVIVVGILAISGFIILIIFLVRYAGGLVALRRAIKEIPYPGN